MGVCVCEAGASLMRPCLSCLARGDAKRMKAADFCVRAGAALLRVAAAAAAAAKLQAAAEPPEASVAAAARMRVQRNNSASQALIEDKQQLQLCVMACER